MNKHLITFSNWRYYKSAEDLVKSAQPYVDKIYSYHESDIDVEFYTKHINLFREVRGFGYWVWKSYFINKLLKEANDDDVFLYVDAGNTVVSDLAPIYDIVHQNEKGILLFDNSDGSPTGENWKNVNWTKSDCFNLLGLTTNEFVYGNQVNGSYIAFKKTNFTEKFFDVFAKASENYNIISNAPSITNDFNNQLVEHRHDQSVLSLLSIKYNLQIERDPSQWGNHKINTTSKYGQIFDHHRRSLK
jgi:hypothetical protein